MSAEQQEPLPAIRMTHYATATALEALEREREARWAAQHAADEEAYEASVRRHMDHLPNEGSYYEYGELTEQGWGSWLTRWRHYESDTGVHIYREDWATFLPAADEVAARTEATRRNRGEG